jgi:succinate dehydrogenase / fumarate reductase, iron-sulfur subunit
MTQTQPNPDGNAATTPRPQQSYKGRTIRLRVKRQDRPASQGDPNIRWEEFVIPYKPNMNVISCLMEIQRNPVDVNGNTVSPIVWESNCLEEVCGSCSVVVNGKARQACSTLIDKLNQPITIEPMKSFTVIRDLMIDRQRMFETLKKLKAWIPLDGSYDLGPGPKMSAETAELRYIESTCMTCGVCLEVCPNVSEESPFIGAFAMNQVRLFNSHPTGALNKNERLEALMGEGGIAYCGNSQNCVRACPKEIPLTDSIAEMNAQVNKYALMKLFKR